jgi:hypothetical protein
VSRKLKGNRREARGRIRRVKDERLYNGLEMSGMRPMKRRFLSERVKGALAVRNAKRMKELASLP